MPEQTYTVFDVQAAGYTLVPLRCLYCGSTNVTYLQYVDGGDAHCDDCGTWQDDALNIWELLGTIPVNDDGLIQEPFLDFKTGTDCEEIRGWFEERYEVSVAALMWDKNQKESDV